MNEYVWYAIAYLVSVIAAAILLRHGVRIGKINPNSEHGALALIPAANTIITIMLLFLVAGELINRFINKED